MIYSFSREEGNKLQQNNWHIILICHKKKPMIDTDNKILQTKQTDSFAIDIFGMSYVRNSSWYLFTTFLMKF